MKWQGRGEGGTHRYTEESRDEKEILVCIVAKSRDGRVSPSVRIRGSYSAA